MNTAFQGSRRLLVFCCVLSGATCAWAEREHSLENRISICVNPATPSRVARTEAERTRITDCQEWSTIASTSAVLSAVQFRNCKDKKAPLGDFLRAVLRAWNGELPTLNPVTSAIYESPAKFRLRPIREGESRIDSLIVWKGNAALVVGDANEASAKPDLKRIKVLMPGQSTNCGELTVISADEAGKRTSDPAEVRFLLAHRPRLFWNHWVEAVRGHAEQPVEINTNEYYHYKITLSALDFEASRSNKKDARDRVAPGDVADYLPRLGPYKISVLPMGEFEKRDRFVQSIGIDKDVLKNTLTGPTIAGAGSYGDLAKDQNALYDAAGNGQAAPVFYQFRVTKPGCAALAVVVWSESPRRIVTSWIRPLRAVSDDAPGETPADCGMVSVSRRVGPAAMPWFDNGDDHSAAARIGFVDFGDYSVGSFQDLRYADEEPISWVLQYPLRQSLGDFSDFVNARIKDSSFDMNESSQELAKLLFKCSDVSDADCDGFEALRRLRALAEESPGARVQAGFRDIVNNDNYYIPIHLLEQNAGTPLGRTLRFVQALPVPPSARARAGSCISYWSAGMIVEDVDYFNEKDWRKGFLDSFLVKTRHRKFMNTDTLKALKAEYFERNDPIDKAPEGLLLLAHHGNGDISDTQMRDALTRIKPDDVKRSFSANSIALLVACSVGALGDVNKSSSRLLFKLNEKNVRAAIISPFQVPPRLARRFLENFKAVAGEMRADTSLFRLLEDTKARLRKPTDPEDDNDGLRAAVDIFMVVGDGDVGICKPGAPQ